MNLDPTKYSFGIVDTGNSGKEQLLSESGKMSQVFDPQAKLTEIVLNNRSMMEVLYLASSYVQVPEDQLAKGYVRARDPVKSDADWFHIKVSSSEPARAWLKVKSYGHWFYIAADDVTTRETFALLDALFASVVGNVPGAKPLLTLPVN
ncbi:MAG: hypothetical protein H6827_00215 [Planctomycetes bacterium]|nr:hypothetical protein [Planctomycetota bacterium]